MKKYAVIMTLAFVAFLNTNGQEIFPVIQEENSEKFYQLLDSNSQLVHSTDQSGNTPLHVASYLNRVAFQEALIKHGANIHALNNAGRSALMFAIAGKSPESVKTLIKAGADLHKADQSGRTPIHWCATQGEKETAELLIEHGANVHASDAQLRTPLHLAATMGNTELARVLIDKGALVNVVDYHARTPLFSASWNGHLDIVRLLIDKNAVVDARYIGAASPLTTASVANHTEICKYLISQHADVDLVCNMLVTPIYLSTVNNNKELVQLYLDHQAQVNYRDLAGRSPLYIAVRDGYTEIAQLLLTHGADPYVVDESTGRTLLHIAASNGRKDIFELLIEKGINANTTDNKGYTALDYAIKHGFKTLAKTIKNCGGTSGTTPRQLKTDEICRGLGEGEAYATKLRNKTWAINTRSGMFVLGYKQCGIKPDDASLVNGTLIANELKNIPVYHFDGAFANDAELFNKQEEYNNLMFICNDNNENRYRREPNFNDTSMFFPEDKKPVKVNDIEVTALPGFRTSQKSYLIKSDGLNILWLYWQSDRYKPQEKNDAPIKYLKENGISIDMLFVGVPYADMGPEWISVMEEEYKMAKELEVQAVFPVPSCKMGEYFYNERKRKGDGKNIYYATNPGEVFHYKAGKVSRL